MIRLYFNRRNDPAGCWSVDHGPSTPEQTAHAVSVAAFGLTREDLTKHGPDEVSAWVEFEDAIVTGSKDRLFISNHNYDPKTN